MSSYLQEIEKFAALKDKESTWGGVNPEYAARMHLQNRFKNGIEIAKYTADIMRKDMAEYDADSSSYTQSLGCWHGFTAQQLAMSVKKHRGTMDKRSSTRPKHAREDICASSDRRNLYLLEAG
jgi:isocitrate lyase